MACCLEVTTSRSTCCDRASRVSYAPGIGAMPLLKCSDWKKSCTISVDRSCSQSHTYSRAIPRLLTPVRRSGRGRKAGREGLGGTEPRSCQPPPHLSEAVLKVIRHFVTLAKAVVVVPVEGVNEGAENCERRPEGDVPCQKTAGPAQTRVLPQNIAARLMIRSASAASAACGRSRTPVRSTSSSRRGQAVLNLLGTVTG